MLLALNPKSPESNFDLIRSYTGKPIGNPPPLESNQKLGQFMQFNQSFLSVSAAIRIGFSGFGAFTGSSEHKVWLTDYGVSASQADLDIKNGVDSWIYGAGYRVGVLMGKSTNELRAGLATFAAEATLNNAKMIIQIMAYGIPNAPPIPITATTNFDVEAYGKYIAWQTEVARQMTENRDQLLPVLTHVAVTTDIQRYLERLLPLLFALRRLEDRHTFKDALLDGQKRGGVDVIVLRTVYAHYTGNPMYLSEGSAAETAPITEAASNNAKNILSYYDAPR
jgi:hypothetical protein